MMQHELTAPERAATSRAMGEASGAQMGRRMTGRHRAMMAGAVILSAGLGGCINIAAPEKPIVIELNINIRQEVIYRLAEDAANTIEENPDIF
jgi:hypothetical protein